ncbi:cellulose biosynthesis protein BcsG [Chromobacterium subtsugae]|uniref:cellulose biosynthesis protein BcsG n=1 Tax=Chromobacterium subtsugae TaxID=251747 RepID=UPI0006410461|nr:cellulose biosynthesis protein BcsG [Chromobacterium subtsugae]
MKSSQSATPDTVAPAAPRSVGLGAWSVYFIAKLLLSWQGTLNLHPLPNLAFALALLIPISGKTRLRLRAALALLAGAALLYHDSWLPSPSMALQQLSTLQGFSFHYLLDLAGRVLSLSLLTGALILLCGYWLLSRYLRLGTIVMISLLGLSGRQLWQEQPRAPAAAVADSGAATAGAAPNAAQTPDQQLAAFFKSEGQRMVKFQGPLADPGFDVLILHVCSLSWDDLRAIGMDQHPLLGRFDFLFSNFNSATPYSGPAALRVLRASCGQPKHSELYQSAPKECYLFEDLAALGFKTELTMNHDGSFDDFLKQIRSDGRLNQPLISQQGLPVGLRSFDNTPIYSDYAVLNRWLEQRQQDSSAHVATYYNTISLHDGNRIPSAPGLNTMDSYKYRANRLFADLSQFIDQLEKSHRKMVLVLVPEHGAALRGDKQQFSGLREIPTPHITIVPAAVKVIGGQAHPSQVRIDQPSSYLAVSTILSRMMTKSPFGADYQPAEFARDLPTTPYVSESASSIVMQSGKRFLLQQDGGDWTEYPVQ